MKVTVTLLALFCVGVYAKVSEDCLWGRESPETCCKSVPDGDSTHLANPKECSSFYLCKENKPLLWSCLPGQVWNVEKNKCEASDNTNQCPQKASLRFIFKEISEDCLWGKQSAEDCCKDIPNGNSAHLANPKECGSFYLCKDNEPLLWPCLPGQVWDVEAQKCAASDTPNKCQQLQ